MQRAKTSVSLGHAKLFAMANMGRMREYLFTFMCILLYHVYPNISGILEQFMSEIFQSFADPRDFALPFEDSTPKPCSLISPPATHASGLRVSKQRSHVLVS